MKPGVRRLSWLVGTVCATMFLGSSPSAAVDWLVLVVDRSNSIDDRELALQRNAYVRLLSDASVIGALGDARVAIVEFDTVALLAGKSGHLVIDVSGDGKENVDSALLSDMRTAAGERAIEINGLAILTEETPEIDRYYSQQVVNGFVVPVEEAGDFESALKRKLFYEVAGSSPDASADPVAVASTRH
jgi:hypothetical protein